MKKLTALLCALLLLLGCLSVHAEDYLDLPAEGTYFHSPLYGLALVDMPESFLENGSCVNVGIMNANQELGAAMLYANLVIPMETTFNGNKVDTTEVTIGYALVGMDGDLSPENAKAMAKEACVNFDEFTEYKRIDGHNIYVQNTRYEILSDDDPTPELDEYIRGYQKELPAMFQNVVNIRHQRVADRFTFTTDTMDGEAVTAADIFAQADYTLLCVWHLKYKNECKFALQELEKTAATLEGVQVVSICDDTFADEKKAVKNVKSFVKKAKLTGTVLLSSEESKLQLPMSGYPTVLLVDKDANKVAEKPGGSDTAEGYLNWLSELAVKAEKK